MEKSRLRNRAKRAYRAEKSARYKKRDKTEKTYLGVLEGQKEVTREQALRHPEIKKVNGGRKAAGQHQRDKSHVEQGLITSEDTISVGAFGKLMGQMRPDMGVFRLFEWMRQRGYLCKRKDCFNQPTAWAISLGVLELYEKVWWDENGRTRLYLKPMVTGKGQLYFRDRVGFYGEVGCPLEQEKERGNVSQKVTKA